jgi:hypothetical protein
MDTEVDPPDGTLGYKAGGPYAGEGARLSSLATVSRVAA